MKPKQTMRMFLNLATLCSDYDSIVGPDLGCVIIKCYYFCFSARVVSADMATSDQQVQCLTDWAGGSNGKALTLAGSTLTVSSFPDDAYALLDSYSFFVQIVSEEEPSSAPSSGGVAGWVWAIVVILAVAVVIILAVVIGILAVSRKKYKL